MALGFVTGLVSAAGSSGGGGNGFLGLGGLFKRKRWSDAEWAARLRAVTDDELIRQYNKVTTERGFGGKLKYDFYIPGAQAEVERRGLMWKVLGQPPPKKTLFGSTPAGSQTPTEDFLERLKGSALMIVAAIVVIVGLVAAAGKFFGRKKRRK